MCSPAKMTTFNWIITAGNTDPKLEASMKCNLCLTPIKDLEIGFSVASLLLFTLFTIQNLIKLKQAIFVLPNNVFILLGQLPRHIHSRSLDSRKKALLKSL